MNVPSTPPAKSPLIPCPRRAAIAFLAFATGAKIAAKGSYLIIFKRQPNGSWQIVQHVWTGTPPPGT